MITERIERIIRGTAASDMQIWIKDHQIYDGRPFVGEVRRYPVCLPDFSTIDFVQVEIEAGTPLLSGAPKNLPGVGDFLWGIRVSFGGNIGNVGEYVDPFYTVCAYGALVRVTDGERFLQFEPSLDIALDATNCACCNQGVLTGVTIHDPS